MTDARRPLAELLEKAGETDFLRAVAEAVQPEGMAELTAPPAEAGPAQIPPKSA